MTDETSFVVLFYHIMDHTAHTDYLIPSKLVSLTGAYITENFFLLHNS